jgi:antitoxin component of RelBE/YafQ-DinJ toxin-antitoxin module
MRSKPEVVSVRVTKEMKDRFYRKLQEAGKTPQEVLESFIVEYVEGGG